MRARHWAGALGLVAVLSAAGVAHAEEPVTIGHIQPSFGFRYGAKLGGGTNPWGPGLGLELGYTLPSAVYLGGSFDYFFGEKSTNLWELMGQAGYDIGVGRSPQLLLRPKVGLGAAMPSGDGGRFVTAPGATIMFITSGFLLALDGRLDLVFAGGPPLKAIVFSVGIGF